MKSCSRRGTGPSRSASPASWRPSPNEPPMQSLRKWIAALEQAHCQGRPGHHQAVLKDAIPEFGSNRRFKEILSRSTLAIRHRFEKLFDAEVRKIVVASQALSPPIKARTAAIMSAIANHLTKVDRGLMPPAIKNAAEKTGNKRKCQPGGAARMNTTPIAVDGILVDANRPAPRVRD